MRTDRTRPPAVVLGGSYNAVSVVRALGRAGIAVHVLDGGTAASYARRSRYAASAQAPSGADIQVGWLDWLRSADLDGAVLLACSDDALELLARNRDELEALSYRVPEADDAVVLAMLDKARTYQLAAAAGIAVPATVTITGQEDLEAAAAIGFPCALKPLHSHQYAKAGHAGKAVVVGSAGELEGQGARFLRQGLAMLVTEIIPGPDDQFVSYYSVLDADGEPLLHFTKRKLRQYPINFGGGTFHETMWDPEVAELGLGFFRGVGLRGLGNVEFKRDERDGSLKLIECNARLTAANDLLLRAGLDLARFVYQRAIGDPEPAPATFRDGVHQWLPGRDLRALRDYRRTGQLTTAAWLRSFGLRPPQLPVFSLRDPAPSLGRVGRLARRARNRASSARR